MPTEQILQLLIMERDKLNQAIDALGGLGKKRRGRPAKNPYANAPDWVKPKRKKRVFTAKQRKEQALRMKKYWAEKRKAEKKA